MKYTRRDFLKLAGAGWAGWMLGWRRRANLKFAPTIRILSLARSLMPETVSAFTDSIGVTVDLQIAAESHLIADQILDSDLAVVPVRALIALIRRGLVRPLEPMALPPMPQRAYDPLNAFSLPAARGAIGINSRGTAHPESWAELLTLARAVPAYLPAAETFNAALKALGHSINTRDTFAREQARALVSTVPSVSLDRSYLAIGHPLSDWAFNVPSEGAELWEDCYCIPADSFHPQLAQSFIQFAVNAQPPAPLPQVSLEPHSPFAPLT